MKNIKLVIPKKNEYFYKEKLESDAKTMSYNAGYEVTYNGYHYKTGCIEFNKENWFRILSDDNRYFAYIKDCDINEYVGYVNYQYNENEDIYECGILIESKYRSNGYAKDALKLLIREVNKNGINYLYDTFEKEREHTLELFLNLGFGIYKETKWKKFDKDVDGVIVRINTNKALPDITKINNIYDVMDFMKNNIRYGWLDINGEEHIGNMKNFRKLYRTMSIDDILSHGIGTCIEQVNLIHYLLNKINICNKMFVTRIYEPDDFNDLDKEEHMHVFILCFINNKVYHIEHANWYNIGIYEYESEDVAKEKINKYYVELSEGIPRPLTEIYNIESGLSFKDFNKYVNSLKMEKI